MKKLIPLLLAAALLLTLVGCDMDYKGKLVGTWSCIKLDDDETKESVMDNIELYDEEKALVNTPLYTVKNVVFNEDGTYYFIEDVDGVKKNIRLFFKGLFTDLYEGRANLTDCYETDLSQLTEEEFYKFYYELYGYTSMDEMLDDLSENIYNYEGFEPFDEGTFKASSRVISFDAVEDDMDGTADYKLEDDKLTITFSNGTEVYTKK